MAIDETVAVEVFRWSIKFVFVSYREGHHI